MRERSTKKKRHRAACGFVAFSVMILAFSTARTCGQGQTPGPQGGGLNATNGESLANAHLSGTLRKKIERDLDWQDLSPDDRAETEHTSTVYHLSFPASKGLPARRMLRVSGGGPPCGRGGNCPEFLYEEVSGARLFKGNGYNLVFLSATNSGAPDLEIDDSLGPADLFHSVYRFDGAAYRQRRRWKYCCGN